MDARPRRDGMGPFEFPPGPRACIVYPGRQRAPAGRRQEVSIGEWPPAFGSIRRPAPRTLREVTISVNVGGRFAGVLGGHGMRQLGLRTGAGLRAGILSGVLIAGWATVPPPALAGNSQDGGMGTSPAVGVEPTSLGVKQAALVPADSTVIFPTVEGSNLEGTPYVLPRDLEGRCNLLFIAFLREQQEMVDTWLPAARYLMGVYPELRYYELPTIARLNPVTRWFIDRGMRGGISDPAARAATITLYIDKEPFRRALGIEGERTITVLLLDARGRVAWRTEGPRTDALTQELNRAVRRWIRDASPSAVDAR